MRKIILLAGIVLSSMSASAATNVCLPYLAKADYMAAIDSVATAAQYSAAELCTLPKLQDLYVTSRTLYNEKNQAIPHTWVTLQYSDYACQYFVREADLVITKANCYNTW